jgi:hypothetical protein
MVAMLAAGSLPGGVAQGTVPGVRPVFSAAARYHTADSRVLEHAYVGCLGSTNDGVVESAIAQAAWMKLALPDVPFKNIQAALGILSVNGGTATIRYKAYLAGLVFDDPAMFAREAAKEYSSSEHLFSALGQRLQSTLLGYSDRRYVRPE